MLENEHRLRNANPNFCYCPGSLSHFQSWLRARYGDLQALGRAWGRHSFARWENLTPPRSYGPNPESLDWIAFRGDRAHELMRWRADVIRSVDPDCAITAHGLATTFSSMPANSADDWRAAAEMVSQVGAWATAPEQARLWTSRPIRGEIGIVYVPEAERFPFALPHGTIGLTAGVWQTPTAYTQSREGGYRLGPHR